MAETESAAGNGSGGAPAPRKHPEADTQKALPESMSEKHEAIEGARQGEGEGPEGEPG